MFCKWCGGTLASSDIKCKRCGKEVPALSDCGGFFDLVPDARKNTADQADYNTSPPSPPPDSEGSKNKTSTPKLNFKWIALPLVGIVLIMLLLLFNTINKYSNEVGELRNELSSMSERIDLIAQTTQNIETKLDEVIAHAVNVGTDLKEQNINFTVKLISEDAAQKIDTDINLGDYVDTAVVSYELDKQTGEVNSVGYYLKEANGIVTVSIDHNNAFLAQNVSVSYEVDDTVYGVSAPVICKWQYRFNENAEWVGIPVGTFKQRDIIGKTELSINQANLRELMNENTGNIELRCEISRSNENNGSLTIVVEGIQFYTKTSNDE